MGNNSLACYFDGMGIFIVWIPCGCHRGIAVDLSEFLGHYDSVIHTLGHYDSGTFIVSS